MAAPPRPVSRRCTPMEPLRAPSSPDTSLKHSYVGNEPGRGIVSTDPVPNGPKVQGSRHAVVVAVPARRPSMPPHARRRRLLAATPPASRPRESAAPSIQRERTGAPGSACRPRRDARRPLPPGRRQSRRRWSRFSGPFVAPAAKSSAARPSSDGFSSTPDTRPYVKLRTVPSSGVVPIAAQLGSS